MLEPKTKPSTLQYKDITHTQDPFTQAFLDYLFTLKPRIAQDRPEITDEYIASHLEDPEFMTYYMTTQDYDLDLTEAGSAYYESLGKRYKKLLRLFESANPIKRVTRRLKKAIKPGYIYVIKYELPDGSVKNITINQRNMLKIFKVFNNVVTHPESLFSDTSLEALINEYNIVSINKHKVSTEEAVVGSYFPYLNKTGYDLKRYQIITKPKYMNIYNEHCLIYTLRMAGLSNSQLDSVRPLISSAAYPSNKLTKIADILQRNIYLTYLRHHKKAHHPGYNEMTYQERTNHYPIDKKYKGDHIHIALFAGHYFVYDQVNVNSKTTTSLKLIYKSFQKGLFVSHTCFSNLPHYFNHSTNPSINTSHQEQCLIPETKKIDYTTTAIIFADTEACTNNRYLDKDKQEVKKGEEHDAVYKEHKAFRYGYVFKGSDKVTITSTYSEHFDSIHIDCIKQGYTSAIIYYHNLQYDFTLMKKEIKHPIVNIIQKGTQLYEVKLAMGKDFMVYLRDSYKMIPNRLEEFAGCFNLKECKQDHYLYDLYDKHNIEKQYVSVTTYLDTGKRLQYYALDNGHFIQTIKDKIDPSQYIILDNKHAVPSSIINSINTILPGTISLPKTLRGRTSPGLYYHMRHCDHYLKYDCLVLQQGISIFRDLLFDTIGLDVYAYTTISSIAHQYALTCKAYEGVWSINNTTRTFVTQCMAGGRVATRHNNRHISFCRVEDYDGVSLYPSAIYRLCKEIGLPACQFQEITNEKHFRSIKKNKKTIYYFVEIEALQDTKEQGIAFPRIEEEGKIVYTNKINGKRLYLGRIALEDLENFCGLSKYKFIKGIYWSESDGIPGHCRNDILSNVVNKLFKARLDAKEVKNKALETTLKLALNSLYGKNMLGLMKTRYVCKTKKNMHDYLLKNYSNIRDYEEIGNSVIFKTESQVLKESNNIHIACMILDMSKRIMNEVMDLADSLDIVILYTDTDSMHIINDNNQVTKLETEYKAKYDKVLNGKQLGQFHCDFDLPGATDIHAIKTLIIDKKVYYDKVKGTDKEGKDVYKDLCIFKGINKEALKEQVIKYGSKEKVYQYQLEGGRIPYNICYEGKTSFLLNGLVPLSRTSFIRVIKFSTNAEIEIHRPGKKIVKTRLRSDEVRIRDLLEDKKETLDNPAIYGEVI